MANFPQHQVGDIFSLPIHSQHPVDRDPEGYPGCVMYSPPDSVLKRSGYNKKDEFDEGGSNSKRNDHYIMKTDEFDERTASSDRYDFGGVESGSYNLYVRVETTNTTEGKEDGSQHHYYIVTLVDSIELPIYPKRHDKQAKGASFKPSF